MAIVAELDTTVNGQPQQRPNVPSVQKYGAIIAECGFTQYPRLVEDYLNTFNLCSTAIRLVEILISYRWQPEQEVYPSVSTLAARLKVSPRRVNQITAQVEELGLFVKIERFAERSQISNIYDLEPLFRRAAAWRNAEVAASMTEQEGQADEPFEPQDVVEQAAQIISEEFGEPEPRQQRYNAERLGRRWEKNPHLEWDTFAEVIERAAEQTEARAKEPTRSGKPFTKLVAYFFSALDYWLKKIPAPTPTVTTQLQPAQNGKQPGQAAKQTKGPQQPPKKSGVLAERAAERRAAGEQKCARQKCYKAASRQPRSRSERRTLRVRSNAPRI